MNALESLERERVGLAPAAARLLEERDRFGEGALIGPLSDFITADTDAAALVERFLGPTVHAVIVRDRDTAEAVRVWHASTNPGPLLLLPLDAELNGDSNGSVTDNELSRMVLDGSVEPGDKVVVDPDGEELRFAVEKGAASELLREKEEMPEPAGSPA